MKIKQQPTTNLFPEIKAFVKQMIGPFLLKLYDSFRRNMHKINKLFRCIVLFFITLSYISIILVRRPLIQRDEVQPL